MPIFTVILSRIIVGEKHTWQVSSEYIWLGFVIFVYRNLGGFASLQSVA